MPYITDKRYIALIAYISRSIHHILEALTVHDCICRDRYRSCYLLERKIAAMSEYLSVLVRNDDVMCKGWLYTVLNIIFAMLFILRSRTATCELDISIQGRRQLRKSGGANSTIARCLHFSVIRMGSRGTFVLCTAS